MTRYYERFVQDFAKIASLLAKLIRKEMEYVWTEQCSKAFEKFK